MPETTFSNLCYNIHLMLQLVLRKTAKTFENCLRVACSHKQEGGFFFTEIKKRDIKLREHLQKKIAKVSRFWPLRQWSTLIESIKKRKFVKKNCF